MVRATYARVLVRTGGTLPVPFTEAAVTALCTNADYLGDGITEPETLSLTDNEVIEIFVDIVLNMMAEATWLHAGGYLTGRPKPEVMSNDIITRLRGHMSRAYGPQAVDMIDTDD